MENKSLNSEGEKNNYKLFFFMLLITVGVNYYTPAFLRITYFLGLLYFFYKSKNNAIWLAFFWCLLYAPAYLFNAADPNYCLPFFGLPGLDRDISFSEILVIVIFFKSTNVKTTIRINRIYWTLVFFSLILLVVTVIWGVTAVKVFRTIRFLIPYTMFWSIPKLLSSMKKLCTLFNYFLIFTIPIILCQLYVIFSGQHLMFLLGGSFGGKKEAMNDISFDSAFDLIRPLYSTHILLLNVFYCLFLLLADKANKFLNKPKYVPLFLVLSFLSFLITGTRGYVLASLTMLLLFSFINVKKLMINIQYVLLGIGLFLMLILTPGIGTQFRLSLERIFTLQSLVGGDKTAEGTLIRLTERQPKVLAKAEESPILGFGFSNSYYENADGHVANASLLLNSGVIGILVFVFFIAYLIFESFMLFRITKRTEVLSVMIGLSGFLLVHSSSYMVFSYAIGQGNSMAFLLLLAFINVLIEEYKVLFKMNNRLINPIKFQVAQNAST